MTDKPSRNDVIEQDGRRRSARSTLVDNGQAARLKIAPAALLARWKNRQSTKLSAMVDGGKSAAKKNAPIIGITAAGALLFTVRKPILKAIRNLRDGKS